MAIRVGQQAPGATAGIMAYAAGLKRARQKSLVDMSRMGMGQRYRTAMNRQAKQPEGTWAWEDPLALNEKPEDRVQFNAKQRANARRRRLGLPIKHPEVEGRMQFKPAPDKQEIEQGKFDRGVKQDAKELAEKREFDATKAAEQQEFDMAEDAYEDFLENIDAIREEGPDAWRDPTKGKKFEGLYDDLDKLQKQMQEDKNNPHRVRDYHRAAADRMQEFFEGFNRKRDILPFEERKGNERKTPDGRIQQKTQDGEWVTTGLVEEPGLTREHVDQGRSKNWRRTPLGGYQQRVLGKGGVVEWVDVEPPKAAADQAAEQQKNRTAFQENYIKGKGGDSSKPAAWVEAGKAADAVGLTAPGAASGAPTPAAPGGAPGGVLGKALDWAFGGAAPPAAEEGPDDYFPESRDLQHEQEGDLGSMDRPRPGSDPSASADVPPAAAAGPSVRSFNPDTLELEEPKPGPGVGPEPVGPGAPATVASDVDIGGGAATGDVVTPEEMGLGAMEAPLRPRPGAVPAGSAPPPPQRVQRPDQRFGKPVAPPTDYASQRMAARGQGYDYVPRLDAQGQETGEFTWRPRGTFGKQPQAQAPASRKLSPDGKWEWDGTQWVPSGGA